LLAKSDVGRSVDIEVLFEKPFEAPPRVALATSMIDMEGGAPNGYTTELVFVNERGILQNFYFISLRIQNKSDCFDK